MRLTGLLLRWYRSFNVLTLGPADDAPTAPWHSFRNASFPFVHVPLDNHITTIVGANESGKSHLLSAVAKTITGEGISDGIVDAYAIKDICRYCGFSGLDTDVSPQIGLEFRITSEELAFFDEFRSDRAQHTLSDDPEHRMTAVFNCGPDSSFTKVYFEDFEWARFDRNEWLSFAERVLPDVSILNSKLALPNDVHIDELIDLFENKKPMPIVDPLAVQDLWRNVSGIKINQGTFDENTAKRVDQLKDTMAKSSRRIADNEAELVLLLFEKVLKVRLKDLKQIRQYSGTEKGFVQWLNDDFNARLDRELDISRYWDQDEDFRLTLNYKSGTFHFQITDRTGSTYTFNERSSGLRYFLSYYIQAKAMEGTNKLAGSLILMDEPDSFLSASGQRSLLRVFEALVKTKRKHGPCQLIYSTHSPFLINRNFPDRIRLVRKGDGSEGTQYVQRSAIRRFEPVRSALSIDSADTLFLGSINVVVEGHSDQKLIAACIQRFIEPGKLELMLDLNSVTVVSADGAPNAPDLVKKAMRGDEKPPIVVVLLDGDSAGDKFAKQVAQIIDPKQVCTLREIESPGNVFTVLEDIIPVPVVREAIKAFTGRLGVTRATEFDGSSSGADQAKRIVRYFRDHVPALSEFEDIELRGGVIDSLVEHLGNPQFACEGLDVLHLHVRQVCDHINLMIQHAQRNSGQQSLRKLLRQRNDLFLKKSLGGASKGEMRQLLQELQQVAYGRGEDFESTRQNIQLLMELLDTEAQQNSDAIDIRNWEVRLNRLRNEPWAKVKSWKTLVAPPEIAPPKSDEIEAGGDGDSEDDDDPDKGQPTTKQNV